MPPREKQSPESIAAGILFIALFIVVMIQVLGRTPLFVGPVWTEELARWIWVWMAFVAIGEVERADGQLRMGFVADALPQKLSRGLYTLIDLAYFGMMSHMLLISWRTIRRTMNSESVTLPWPDALLYASVFAASLLILHRVARRIVSRLRKANPDAEAAQ